MHFLPAVLAFSPAPRPGLGAAPRAGIVKAVNQRQNEFCYGLPGATAPFGKFDPLNFLEGKSKEEVYRWREAEITHGRVGMLASAGFLVQEKWHPLFDGVGGPAIKQIPQLPVWVWFVMTMGIAFAEALRIQKGWANPYDGEENIQRLKPGYMPGDLGWDPLGLKPTDPKAFKRMQEKELNNGRLGMIAAAGFMAQEAVTGTTWSESAKWVGWWPFEAASSLPTTPL